MIQIGSKTSHLLPPPSDSWCLHLQSALPCQTCTEAAENQSVKDGSRDNSDDNSDDEKDEEGENEAEEEVCWIEFKGTNDIAISKLI